MNNVLVNCFVAVFRSSLVLVLLCGGFVFGQDGIGLPYTNNSFNSNAEVSSRIRLPKSPEADAFEKYGTTPVNLYTGTPEISIPLHTFKGREFDVPMILTYDASGIKVSQIATNVGLGWNLSLGGRISRISNGKPDDIGRSPFFDEDNVDLLNYLENGITSFNSEEDLTNYLLFMKEVLNNQRDTLLDFYSLNAIGINDYIVRDLEQPTLYHTLLNPNIIVTPLNDGWKILVEDGTEFYFDGLKERTEITHISSGDDNGIYSGTSTSSWVLTKIISKNKLDTFDFDYKYYTWSNFATTTISSRTYKIPSGNFNTNLVETGIGYSAPESYRTSQMMPYTVKLNNELLVKFDYKARTDLNLTTPCYQNGNALDKILFYNYKTPVESPTYYKKIVFEHGYFGRTDVGTTAVDRRLKLNSLVIYKDDLLAGKKYSFDYERPDQIPKLNTNCQDLLGSNNGRNNSDLVPKIYDTSGSELNHSGADRNPYFDYMTIGTLNKITYPSKGYTTFEYEQNEIAVNPETIYHQGHYIGEFIDFFNFYDSDQYECNFFNLLNDNMMGLYSIDTQDFNPESANGDYLHILYAETTLLTIETAKNFKFEFSGFDKSICLIQKLTECENANYSNVASCNDAYGQPINYYSCMHPTNSLFMDSYTSYSYPQEFIAGGLIGALRFANGTPLTDEIYLEAGKYQVTLWKGGNWEFNADFPKLKLMEYFQTDWVPAVTTYTYTSKKIEGFRVKNIKNFTEGNVPVRTKEYKYIENLDSNFPSGIQLNTEKSSRVSHYLADGTCAGDTVEVTNFTIDSSNINTIPNVGYASVFEIEKEVTAIATNGYVQTKYNVGKTGITYSSDGIPSFIPNFENGKIKEKNIFNKDRIPQIKENYFYESIGFYDQISFSFMSSPVKYFAWADNYNWALQTDAGHILHCFEGGADGSYADGDHLGPTWDTGSSNDNYPDWYSMTYGDYSFYPTLQGIYGKYGYLARKETVSYPSNGGEMKKTEEFTYDPIDHYRLQNKTITLSDGTITNEYYAYSPDYPTNPEKITDIITSSGNAVTQTNNLYEDIGIGSSVANMVTQINIAKGANALEPRLKFDYNPTTKNIVSTLRNMAPNAPNTDYDSYIFGYDDQFLVAKLEGVKYSDIPQNLIIAIRGISKEIINEANTNALLTALNNLRTAFPNAMITTYTYDPVIGMTSQTDAKGYITYYEYDELNRLLRIKDADGNILKENQYHYKN